MNATGQFAPFFYAHCYPRGIVLFYDATNLLDVVSPSY